MTAKAKAKELVDRFNKFPFATLSVSQNMDYAKQCALICVNEINDELDNFSNDDGYQFSRVEFYTEVKQEIEKLKQ